MEKRSISPDAVLSGYPYSLAYLMNQHNRIGWDDFVEFMGRFERAIGGAHELEDAGAVGPEVKAYRSVHALMGYFASPRHLYWMLTKILMPQLFRNVQVKYEELRKDALRITVSIDEGYAGCEAMFRMCAGGLRMPPTMLGLPPARVNADLSERKAVYLVTLPPTLSLWRRTKRAGKAVFAARAAVEEMSQQEERIKESYKRFYDAEMKLQISSRAASLAKMSAVGEMARGMAHEINNPLAAMDLKLQIMGGLIRGGRATADELETQLSDVRILLKRIAHVVDSLRLFSRDAGSDPLAPASVKDLVEHNAQFCRERFKAAGIRFEIGEIPAGLEIRCRQTQVSQALLSLLNNAFDAVSGVADKWIRVDAGIRGDEVLISVTDAGPGISAEVQEKMFQPFFTTKEVGEGSGLGLSVSKGVVESQGGKLELDRSSPRTRFVIRFPLYSTVTTTSPTKR